MTIGKSYESTKIEVQECSANRPPAKESIKAVSKNKPKKVLMCNYSANKMGARRFQTRNLAAPGEQSTESERSKITFKTQRSIKEV